MFDLRLLMMISIYLASGLIFSLFVFRKERPGWLTETVAALLLILAISVTWPYVLMRGIFSQIAHKRNLARKHKNVSSH